MKNQLALKENDTHLDIIEVAERLFHEVGFHKTTVTDIARELRMSPANIYRFFSAKSEINVAVCRRLFSEVEAAAEIRAQSPGPASETLRNLIASIDELNMRRFLSDRKLHELFEAAYDEKWVIVREHTDKIDRILARIISKGMAAGEFRAGDAELAAILIRSACVRFSHPRLVADCAQDPEPTLDQMVDFCLAALA